MNSYQPLIVLAAYIWLCVLISVFIKLLPINTKQIFHIRHGYPVLDTYRGILAFFVFMAHSVMMVNIFTGRPWTPAPEAVSQIADLGMAGVNSFFFITGFLFWPYVQQNKLSGNFFEKRLFRLLPAYLFACTVIVGILFVTGTGGLFDFLKVFMFTFSSPSENSHPFSFVLWGTFWSLKYEWMFYLLLPLLAALLKFGRLLPFFLLAIICIFVDKKFVPILLGAIVSELNQYSVIKRIATNSIYRFVVILLMLVYIIIETSGFDYLIRGSIRYLTPLAFFVVLINITFEIPKNRYFDAIMQCGILSYSLYLTHGISLVLTYYLIRNFSIYSFFKDNIEFYIFIAAPVTAVLSVFTFWIGERPYFMRYKKNLYSQL